MIKFFDNIGNIYEGSAPYIHWIDGAQSCGLWYSLNLYILSDHQTLTIKNDLDKESVFKLISIPSSVDENTDIQNLITEDDINITSNNTDEASGLYAFQIILVCYSDSPGQFIDGFSIEEPDGEITQVRVGADLYIANDSLSINLSNKGLDIPQYIQKAFYETNYREANIDNILINRKFKELVSNFIDIVDCKGSYKSLINSLDWFDWGENTKLYEIWENGEGLIEKDLEPILSDIYKNFITSHRKTTHLALSTALYKNLDDPEHLGQDLDEDKNPKITHISHRWADEDLAVKISILGAFFERYFMPIHLDLKRVSVESLVYTTGIKLSSGTQYCRFNYHDDIGIIDMNINDGNGLIIPLGVLDSNNENGNYRPVAVGPDTMFGIRDIPNESVTPIIPIGVDFLDNISISETESEYEDHSIELGDFFYQLIGNVGVVIPINVVIKLPEGDGINMEVLTINRDGEKVQSIEKRLFMSKQMDEDEVWGAEFKFYLLSTKEETVSFNLTLHSLSGHTWTTAASFQTVDVTGIHLKAYKVTPKQINELKNEFIDNIKDNPWVEQYNTTTIDQYDSQQIDPKYYHPKFITQYIPTTNNNLLHELIMFEGEGELSPDLFFKLQIKQDNDVKNTIYIRKESGKWDDTIENTIRHEMIFIPQLCNYTALDDMTPVKLSNYEISQDELICIIPQFKQSLNPEDIDISYINWIFTNKTTGEIIKYDIPISKPLIANDTYKLLTPGYWSATMNFLLSNTPQSITRNSLFKIIKKEETTI